jgi:hypothetical protein
MAHSAWIPAGLPPRPGMTFRGQPTWNPDNAIPPPAASCSANGAPFSGKIADSALASRCLRVYCYAKFNNSQRFFHAELAFAREYR